MELALVSLSGDQVEGGYLEEALPSFSQTLPKIFGRSVHLLPAFLLVLFVHGDGG